MHRPAISQLTTKNESYYSLVIAVAKRARQIADELSANNQILEEKPVKIAVEEFASGKCRLIEDPALKPTKSEQ
ncbi:MAG: DNA-directed RNA polymerase subunit omega [Oscillospiraceae bacterium]|nr:DNA-directed RNA polymerase subunit omega [Oscillospiraceae bacterium]